LQALQALRPRSRNKDDDAPEAPQMDPESLQRVKAIFATLDKNNDSFIDNDEIGDFEGWLAMEVGHASVSWFDSEVRQSMENSATHEAVVREETIITAFTHKYLQMKKTFREAEFSRFIEGCQLAATHTANGEAIPGEKFIGAVNKVKFIGENGQRFDMCNCCVDTDDKKWDNVLILKRSDGGGDGEYVMSGDQLGVFSEETGQRLDIGAPGEGRTQTCDADHNSCTSVMEIRSLSGGDIKYGSKIGIFAMKTDPSGPCENRRLSFAVCATDGGHESWATKLHVHKV